jgi:hypothetical protein
MTILYVIFILIIETQTVCDFEKQTKSVDSNAYCRGSGATALVASC